MCCCYCDGVTLNPNHNTANIKGGQGNANFMRVLQDLSEQMGQRSFFRSRRKYVTQEPPDIRILISVQDDCGRVQAHPRRPGDGETRQRGTDRQIRPQISRAGRHRFHRRNRYASKTTLHIENAYTFISDKVCRPSDRFHHSSDASAEGVQRDLLPIIEGSVVNTKHGNVDTSKILFIASGAFHRYVLLADRAGGTVVDTLCSCKPSDLLAELQGRLPIRVELKGLEQADFYRILTEPGMIWCRDSLRRRCNR